MIPTLDLQLLSSWLLSTGCIASDWLTGGSHQKIQNGDRSLSVQQQPVKTRTVCTEENYSLGQGVTYWHSGAKLTKNRKNSKFANNL